MEKSSDRDNVLTNSYPFEQLVEKEHTDGYLNGAGMGCGDGAGHGDLNRWALGFGCGVEVYHTSVAGFGTGLGRGGGQTNGTGHC
jgi:hypothetical protein